jgi:hypothetical protein
MTTRSFWLYAISLLSTPTLRIIGLHRKHADAQKQQDFKYVSTPNPIPLAFIIARSGNECGLTISQRRSISAGAETARYTANPETRSGRPRISSIHFGQSPHLGRRTGTSILFVLVRRSSLSSNSSPSTSIRSEARCCLAIFFSGSYMRLGMFA